MSDRPLPDDVSQWPSDPYALFGISRGADLREVRRAYARLIRAYKPEHAPEQFRRIREAYELLQWRLNLEVAWDEGSLDAVTGPAPSDDSASLPAAPHAEDGSGGSDRGPSEGPTLTPAARPRSDAEEIDWLWDQTRGGDVGQLYQRYVAFHTTSRGTELLYLRLYWLLLLFRELDPQRTACNWLVAGLKQLGVRGRLFELYLAELERDPAAATGAYATELLRAACPLPRLLELAGRRWRSAAAGERWELLADDREQLRPRVLAEDAELWAALLLTAIDQLAWAAAPEAVPLLAACREEVEPFGDGHPALHEALARCDFLLELVAAWRGLHASALPGQFVVPLGALLREAWQCPSAADRQRLLAFLRPLVESPQRGLDFFDDLHGSHGIVLHHLGRLLETLVPEPVPRRERVDANLLVGRVDQFLDASLGDQYGTFRQDLMWFCVGEAIPADEFIEVLMALSQPAGGYESLIEAVARDAPLRYFTQACVAFWA